MGTNPVDVGSWKSQPVDIGGPDALKREGKRIDEFCRERRLPIRARLGLFVQAAAAVASAHARLEMQRNLNPANILAMPDGRVHLPEVGVAGLLEAGAPLAPEYASPEQLAGQPITTASDIYSLGVILYELLCDRRPYELQQGAIPQEDPVLPSTLVHRRRAAVRGDLDTIVMKALRKNPGERYPTVHALIDDVERHLGKRPILARGDRRGYRARKFLARHRMVVGAAVVVALALVAGAVLATRQARMALQAKAHAEDAQAFITSIFGSADPILQGEGRTLSGVDLLKQAEQRLALRKDAAPALKVEMLAVIGESLLALEQNQESARVIGQALELQNSLPGTNPALNARLHLALSKAREKNGDTDGAMTELRNSLEALESVPHPGALAVRARLQESALALATGDGVAAERAAQLAIEAATPLAGARSDEVATAQMLLSKAYLSTERLPDAVAPAKQGFESLLANHRNDYADPKVIEFAPGYADALIHTGDYEAASKLMHDVIAGAERVYGADSKIVGDLASIAVPAELERGELDAAALLARRSLANYLKNASPGTPAHASRARTLGLALVTARTDDSLRALEDAAKLSTQAGDPPATGRSDLGLALAQEGRLVDADEQLRIALDNAKPATHAFSRVARHLGMVLRLRALNDNAIPWLEQSVAGLAKKPADRGEHATSLIELGRVQLELGNVDAAQQSFTTATAALEELQPERMTPARADLLVGMARVHLQRKNFANALTDLQRADAYWREHRPDSRWAGEAAFWLGNAELASGHRAEARAAMARAAKLLAKSRVPADQPLLRLARGG